MPFIRFVLINAAVVGTAGFSVWLGSLVAPLTGSGGSLPLLAVPAVLAVTLAWRLVAGRAGMGNNGHHDRTGR